MSDSMTNEMPRENKMGTMPVKQLIISMSLPMMVSMLVQALYNIVDSVFVAQISESALTAVTLAFPLQSVMIAVGAGTGVGINALLSRSLGEKKFERSDAAANTAILLAFFSFLAFVFIGIFLSRPFILTQTDNAEIIEYGTTYLSIVCTFSMGLFFQVTFERLLQSTGLTLYSMISQIVGAVFNIIFDPILIFGLIGFPRLGVAGAAIATVLGQCLAACIGLFLNLKKNKELHFSLKRILSPKGSVIGRIYYVGVPSILMMSIGSIMTYLMNLILVAFSDTAVAVFGVYFKLQSFFFMPVFGLNNGCVPVLAYNYGARKPDRIKAALKFSMQLAFVVMCCGTAIFELFPGVLLKMFNANDSMMAMGKIALRIIAVHFPLAAIGITLGGVFQAFSKATYSLVVSLMRQLVVLIPVAWLLARLTQNVDAVWWCFPIAEVVSLMVSIFFYRRIKKNIIDKL
ncbi:MAG: MATE family efflux transporter [Lachnospiraceae bacterium]|nr:MATE family efflux transporter [Lachnospiraceae bacterium]